MSFDTHGPKFDPKKSIFGNNLIAQLNHFDLEMASVIPAKICSLICEKNANEIFLSLELRARLIWLFKVQLSELEMQRSSGGSDETTPTDALSRSRRPLSALEPLTLNTIAIQTDDSALRSVKSMGDVIAVQPKINHVASLEKLQESTVENLLSDVVSEKAEKRPISKSQSAFSFKELEKQAQKENLEVIQVKYDRK